MTAHWFKVTCLVKFMDAAVVPAETDGAFQLGCCSLNIRAHRGWWWGYCASHG